MWCLLTAFQKQLWWKQGVSHTLFSLVLIPVFHLQILLHKGTFLSSLLVYLAAIIKCCKLDGFFLFISHHSGGWQVQDQSTNGFNVWQRLALWRCFLAISLHGGKWQSSCPGPVLCGHLSHSWGLCISHPQTLSSPKEPCLLIPPCWWSFNKWMWRWCEHSECSIYFP